MNVALPADQIVKVKNDEKINKYLDLTRELKRKPLCKMKVTVIIYILHALGTVSKDFGKDLV